MISVTMDLMDMSELPVCAPDLASLSSSPQAQATPVTSITDISTFPAQPQQTGEYFSHILRLKVIPIYWFVSRFAFTFDSMSSITTIIVVMFILLPLTI